MSLIPQLIVNGIIAGSVYALIALGFNLIYGVSKFFNLAHGVVAAVCAYIVLYLAKILGLNIYLALTLGVVSAAAVGLILEKTVYLPLRKRKASSMVVLVASLGASIVIQSVIAMIFTSQFQSLSYFFSNQPIYEIFGGTMTMIQLVTFISCVVIFLVLALILKKTLFGQAVRAISDDEEVSKIVGINTNRIIGLVFLIGSAISGLGGILVAFDTGLEPIMGFNLLLKGVIASIIGGVGNIYGAILGAFMLGLVENFGIWKISGEWKDPIAFLLLIIFLIFRPKGIISG